MNPTYPAYYDPYQQQQQQQYYDQQQYYSPTAPQPQYAQQPQQQQQYYYPNQPNAPEAYGSQSPYNNPYINGAHAHSQQMPLYGAHSASPYHRPSPPSHMIPNPTRSHTPPSIQHLAPNRFQQASAQSPEYVRRSRSRSNNPAIHQQHIPMHPAHRRTDTTQSQPPLYKTPPQNKRRATTERGARRRSPQQSSTEKPYWKHQNRPQTKTRRPEYGTSSRQEKPRSPHGRSMSSPPTTKGISGESVKNAYGKRTPNHWALMEDQKVVEPKSTLSPVFEEKQKKLVDAGIDDLIADFNDEEEDDTEQRDAIHESHRDPDSDSDGLPGKGSPPVPQKVINFPTPNVQRPPSEHNYEARSDAASKISSLDGVENTPEENGTNAHYDRQYEFEKRALMSSEPKSRYPDPLPPRDIDLASVTTRTDSEPRKRSPSKEIPHEMAFPEIPESVTTPDKGSRSPDKFSNTLNTMASENEDRVNELFDQLKLDSPRISMGGMDIPDGDSEKPMLEESDDEFELPDEFPNPFASQKSYFKMIGKDEGSEDSSDKYKKDGGVGGLVNSVAFDDDDEEKKKSRMPEFTNKQANLILAVLMGTFGIMLGSSTIGTDNDWWVWVTIAIVGSGMFITSLFACIFGSIAFWDFEDFKTEFQKLDPVKQSDDIRLEIEAQKRKRLQKYKDEQKKLREERQQIANERMKMQWEMDDMITDFWLLHDENLNLIDWENLGNNTASDPQKTDSLPKTKPRRKSTQECLRIFRRLPAEEMEEIIDTYQKMQNQKKKQQKRNSIAGSDAGTSVTSFSTLLSSHRESVQGRRQSAALSDYSHRSGVYVQTLEEVNREPRPIVRDQADEMRQNMWESDSLQDERAPLFDGSRIEMTERPKVRFSVSGVKEPSTTPQVTHTQQASFFTQSGSYQHHENQPLLGGTE